MCNDREQVISMVGHVEDLIRSLMLFKMQSVPKFVYVVEKLVLLHAH